MSVQKSYLNSKGYIGNRPVANVRLNGQGPTIQCLVDTGADYLQLPIVFAGRAGVNTTAGTGVTVGGVPMLRVNNVTIEIELQQVTGVDILFDTTNACVPALGRQAFLRNPTRHNQQSGFDSSDWAWDV